MIRNIKFRNFYKRARILKMLSKKNNEYQNKDNNLKNILNIMCDVDYSDEKLFNFPKNEINFFIRQKILSNCGLKSLSKKFIDSGFLNLNFFAPIPTRTINKIDKIVQVQNFYCKILWFKFLFINIFKALCKVIYHFFYSILPNKKLSFRSVFFIGFSEKMFPNNDSEMNLYNTVTWYIEREKNFEKTVYFHNNKQKKKKISVKEKKIIYKNSVKPKIKRFSKLLNFLFESLFNIFKSVAFWNQYEILLLDEYVDYLLFKNTDKNNLCDKYIFEFGAHLRNPLWTRACVEKNIDVEMLCYSINDSITFNKNKGYFWNKLLNWPKMIVWDKHHKNNFENFNQYKKTKYEIVKIIPLLDSNSYQKLKKDKKIISIFDVHAEKISDTYIALPYMEWIYYNTNSVYLFLNDIGEACRDLNIQLVYKKKRGNRYKKQSKLNCIINDFIIKYDVIEFDNQNSPIKLVEQSDIVISMPFSSPSLIGKLKGKPSCYYDAENSLDKNLDLSHGLDLIQNKINLENWIKLNLTDKND